MYFYNDIQSEEELHDDEVVANLVEGQMMEGAGENWKIVQVETVTVASDRFGLRSPVKYLVKR